ncbi:diguanylate cyclase [Colwelliaceae bacterium 6441]
MRKVDEINKKLTDLEYQFSLVLSEGARWIKNLLMWVSISSVTIMLLLVIYISRRITLGIEHTERELMISEARFKSLYLTDMLGIMEWHIDGSILDANDAFLDMIGYSKEELTSGKVNWRALTPEHAFSRDEMALKEIAEKGFCAPYEKLFIHHDGVTKVPVYLGAALFEGIKTRGICFIVDHTDLKKAHTEMQLSATVFDASNDGILITNSKQKILAVNKAWCELTGYHSDEVVNQPINVLHIGKQPDAFQLEIWQLLKSVNCWQGDVTTCHKDGSDIHIRLGINVVRNSDNTFSHVVITYTDIGEHIALEDRLREMAHYDFLTGLANRSLFNDLLANAIRRAKRNDTIFAVLFIDLDKFKPVNDLYGHDIGDQLLSEIASRYQKVVRGNDIVARIGGDEFVVLLDDIHQASDASRVANMIIEVTNQEVIIEEKSLHVGCSIGISLFPDDGENSKKMLQSADAAMYIAKSSGRNNFVFKSPLNLNE